MAEPRIGKSHIPELLRRLGKTQVDLADYLGVSKGFISQVVSGQSKFSIIKAKMAADFLRCKIEDLNDWIYD